MNEPQQEVKWTPSLLREFKRAQQVALKKHGRDGLFTFVIEGRPVEFVVSFAGYLIAYLEDVFGEVPYEPTHREFHR